MDRINIPQLEQFDAPDIVGEPIDQVLAMAAISAAISLKRIADAAEKIAGCVGGLHSSAFRVA